MSIDGNDVAIVAKPPNCVGGRLAAAAFDQFVAGVVGGDEDGFALAGAVFEQVEPDGFGVFSPVAFAEVVEEEDVGGGDVVEPWRQGEFASFVLGAALECAGGEGGDASAFVPLFAQKTPCGARFATAAGARADDETAFAEFPGEVSFSFRDEQLARDFVITAVSLVGDIPGAEFVQAFSRCACWAFSRDLR